MQWVYFVKEDWTDIYKKIWNELSKHISEP